MLHVLLALQLVWPADSLRRRIESRIAEVPGAVVAVSLRDLASNDSLDINADESFHAASTMKVPVMIELYRQVERGALSLDQSIVLVNEFASIVDGSLFSVDAADDSDSLLYAKVGHPVTIRELMDRMITRSSNLATNALIALVGASRADSTAHALGARRIRVLRGVEDQKAFDAGLSNSTTSRDLATLLLGIETGRAASRRSTDAMRDILLHQEFNDEIPAGLPPGTPVAHKTGWITGVLHDAAVVYPRNRAPYVLVVLTRNIPDERVARSLIVDISRLVYAARVSPRPGAGAGPPNVVLVVADGVRWQDVFHGADSLLVFGNPDVVGGDTARVRRSYWRATASARRAALMPFLWDTIARHGQIYGNRGLGSRADVTNGLKFSYPGYNEMLTGFPDARVNSNNHGPNPNVTVFEWLHRRPELRGRVGAVATWDAFKDIFNASRSGVHVDAGWELPYPNAANAAQSLLNRLYATTFRHWDDNAYDSFAHQVAMRYLTEQHPRVLFVGYGETDEWAHDERYDRTLDALHATDAYVAELWAALQADPAYRGRTTLILTADHGRGRTPRDWKDHGRDVAGAEEIWIAVIGPDTPALGERRNTATVTQAQIAATVAALLGYDYRRDVPRAAPAIGDVVGAAR